jgi:hypothetical protein
MKNKVKSIKLSKDRVYLLESSSSGPTNLLIHQGDTGEKKKVVFLHKKGCNAMSLRGDSFGFTLQNGMDVYDGSVTQHFSSCPDLHSFALSCCDVIRKEESVHVLSGSLDQSLVYHRVSTSAGGSLKFYLVFIVLFISILLFYFKK